MIPPALMDLKVSPSETFTGLDPNLPPQQYKLPLVVTPQVESPVALTELNRSSLEIFTGAGLSSLKPLPS
jgi:hypothetical protein